LDQGLIPIYSSLAAILTIAAMQSRGAKFVTLATAAALTYPRGRQQLAAVQYYLQRISWECTRKWKSTAKGVSNYKALLDHIERAQFGNMGAV
jgi:hypothetical protein